MRFLCQAALLPSVAVVVAFSPATKIFAARRHATLRMRDESFAPSFDTDVASTWSELEQPYTEVAVGDIGIDYFGESSAGNLEPHPSIKPMLEDEVTSYMTKLQEENDWPLDPSRGVFCTRSLNLRAIKCIGYDMDYTLVQYHMKEWENLAYKYAREALRDLFSFPRFNETFTRELACRGLVIDRDLGNVLKINHFGMVDRAIHGTRRLTEKEVDEIYGRVIISLADPRYGFFNTLFSVSEGCLYCQLVDRLDKGTLEVGAGPDFNLERCGTYAKLHKAVTKALTTAHIDGKLKREVMKNPQRFVQRDPALVPTLLEQQAAGKRLVLITNSDWPYTDAMMSHICNREFGGKHWRELFDLVIVSAHKPEFFEPQLRMPLLELKIDKDVAPHGVRIDPGEVFAMEAGGIYNGGHARMVEKALALRPDEMLYVGDHIFTDVNKAKSAMRWRTALVVQELEQEISATMRERAAAAEISALFARKDRLEHGINMLRSQLDLRRCQHGEVDGDGGAEVSSRHPTSERRQERDLARLLATTKQLDDEVAKLLSLDGLCCNRLWGYMLRAGQDKSQLMRQIEKSADIYTSRVSNLRQYSPYRYFRAGRQPLAHDQDLLQ